MLIKKAQLKELLAQKQSAQGADLAESINNINTSEIQVLQASQDNIIKLQEELDEKRIKLNIEQEEFREAQEECFALLEYLEQDLLKKIDELNNIQDTVIKQSKPEIIDLVIKLTKELIAQELESSPAIVNNLINKALEVKKIQPGKYAKLFLKIHPEDKQTASDYCNKLESKYQGSLSINVIEDDLIDQGSCYLESEDGAIDMNFTSQLDIFKKKLLGGN